MVKKPMRTKRPAKEFNPHDLSHELLPVSWTPRLGCFTRWGVEMVRRQFSREFKLEAVRLVKERGVSVVQASRDLDVGENILRRWIKELTADPGQAFPGQGQVKLEQQEIDRLRREVAKLKAERDILKKAAAYFARESL